LVDEHVEGKSCVLDVPPHRVARLRDESDHLDAARPEFVEVPRELAKLAAAVRSPHAAVKDEQQPSVREEIHQRPDASFLIRQREARGGRQRRLVH
jgi:hypothetical protein